jgi:undecaprenyl diphosphate synthase
MESMKIPQHIAVIMDGNGRWAKARSLPRAAGHKAGVDSVREIIGDCSDLGVRALTLYSFSTENWLRPAEEVSELMRLLCWALERETGNLHRRNVKLRLSGRIQELSEPVRRQLESSVRTLESNTGLTLNLALNYGGRAEIVDAVNALLSEGARSVSEEDIGRKLYTAGLPDPDLVVRTSGELRVSNFLLWQIAYSELYVAPVLWPDFRKPHLLEAIAEFNRRERRFGAVETKGP